jgi:hypothetical protein
VAVFITRITVLCAMASAPKNPSRAFCLAAVQRLRTAAPAGATIEKLPRTSAKSGGLPTLALPKSPRSGMDLHGVFPEARDEMINSHHRDSDGLMIGTKKRLNGVPLFFAALTSRLRIEDPAR